MRPSAWADDRWSLPFPGASDQQAAGCFVSQLIVIVGGMSQGAPQSLLYLLINYNLVQPHTRAVLFKKRNAQNLPLLTHLYWSLHKSTHSSKYLTKKYTSALGSFQSWHANLWSQASVLNLALWRDVAGWPLSVSSHQSPCWSQLLFIVAETLWRGRSISVDVIAREHLGNINQILLPAGSPSSAWLIV